MVQLFVLNLAFLHAALGSELNRSIEGCDWEQPSEGKVLIQSALKQTLQQNNAESAAAFGKHRQRTAAPPPPVTNSLAVSMARVADHVYTFNTWSATPEVDWKLTKKWNHKSKLFKGSDRIGIYTKGTQCAVAFAGTDDVSDWAYDLDIRTVKGCGEYKFHRGFYTEFRNFVDGDTWKNEFAPFLQNNCSDIFVTGHSLGGAVATILATCANTVGDPLSQRLGFTVSKLYTIGAPCVAKTQVKNGRSKSGCFDGARFYVQDKGDFDPVPFVACKKTGGSFRHPRVKAVMLHQTKKAWLTKQSKRKAEDSLTDKQYSCTSSQASTASHGGEVLMPSVGKHGTTEYISRIEKLISKNDLSANV